MVKRNLYVALAGAACLLGLGTLFVMRTETGCALAGARWASTARTCITPLCHYSGDCGRWLNPAVRCETILPGTPYRTVHFYFGEPTNVDRERFSWRFGKTDDWTVEADVVGAKVIRLNCPRGE